MLLKAAILLDWVHTFIVCGERNAMFWISHGLIWSNILFYGVGTIAEIFQCTPREKIWNKLYEGGSCPVNMNAHMLASGTINLVSDLIIIALPQQIIWKLHISMRARAGVSLLFTIGILLVYLALFNHILLAAQPNPLQYSACVCGATRLAYLVRMLNSSDQIYTVATTGLWSIGEMTAGFLIIGIPSIPKVIKSTPLTEMVTSLITLLTGSPKPYAEYRRRRGFYSIYKPKHPKHDDNELTMSLETAADARE